MRVPRACIGGERERERAIRERLLAERELRGAEIERARLSALMSGDEAAYKHARALRMPDRPPDPVVSRPEAARGGDCPASIGITSRVSPRQAPSTVSI
jgi:hypothetical protein